MCQLYLRDDFRESFAELAARYSAVEQDCLFHGTAVEVYRLQHLL